MMTPVSGQDSEKKGWGYGFFGAGATTDGSDSEGLIHVGGGVSFLVGVNWGIRVEGRDQLRDFDDGVHNLEGRIGILFSWD